MSEQQITRQHEGLSSKLIDTKPKEQQWQVIEQLKVYMQGDILNYIHEKNQQNRFQYLLAPEHKEYYSKKYSAKQQEADNSEQSTLKRKHFYFLFPKGKRVNIYKNKFYLNAKIVQPKEVSIKIIKLIRDITCSIKQLQFNGIYHANIRLQNICFLPQEQRYKFIDYGECQVLNSSISIAYLITKIIKQYQKKEKSNKQYSLTQRTHKSQLIGLLQVILKIKEIKEHHYFASINEWFYNALKNKEKLLYDDLIRICNETIQIMDGNKQKMQSKAQSQKAYKIEEQNPKIINIGDQNNMKEIWKAGEKILQFQSKQVIIKLYYYKDEQRCDSQINSKSELYRMPETSYFLHKRLRIKKIELQNMILKQLKRLNNLQYIDIPAEITQSQNQNSKRIVQSKFTFHRGKSLKIVNRLQQNPSKQCVSILNSLKCKEFYRFILHLCKGITQLQELGIFHADLNTRNLIYCEGIYKLIDFGEVLCFNEQPQFKRERQISQECISIINELKERKEQVLLDYLIQEKKDKFQQYSFESYKNLYRKMHSRQFLNLFQTYERLRHMNSDYQGKEIGDKIKEFIKHRQYEKLIDLCNQKIEESKVTPQNISQRNKQERSAEQLSQGIQNYEYLYNKDKSQDENIDMSQQSSIHSEINERKNSSDQMVLKSIAAQRQDNVSSQKEHLQSYLSMQNKLTPSLMQGNHQKNQYLLKQQSQQQQCDHQKNSKICLSIKCVEKNQYLLCGCQNGHIHEKSAQSQQCHIVNFKDISKFTNNLGEKIRQLGPQSEYFNLIQSFHKNPLLKIEQYYKQIMQNTIIQLQSLSKFDEINTQQWFAKDNDEKDKVLKLSGLFTFSKFKSKVEFDQYIQFISDSLEQSSSKIIYLAKQQFVKLKNKIDEALNCNESTNIVKKYLNQKYVKLADNPQYKGGSDNTQLNGQKNNVCCIKFTDIKKHHMPKVESLTLGSQTQQSLQMKSFRILRNKLQQLQWNSTLNNNGIVMNLKQKMKKIQLIQADWKKQLHLCETLKFISQNDFHNLKSLNIDLTDSQYNKGHEFSTFSLFHWMSQTSLDNLRVKGVKILQFEQYIRLLYEFKENKSEVNGKITLQKNNYSLVEKFHKFQSLTLQLDIEIRLFFKYKVSLKKQKQQLFFFLDHIKQLEFLTLTLQYTNNQNYTQSVLIIQEIMGHQKIRSFKINIIKRQIDYERENDNFIRMIEKISQYKNKILALEFQNIQFSYSQKENIEDSNHQFGNMISKLLSNNLKALFILNCRGFPMINLMGNDLRKLMISNSTFQTKIEIAQKFSIHNKIQQLCIKSSKDILDKCISSVNFKNIKYLNITLNQSIEKNLLAQKLPLLKVFIIQRQKYENNYELTKLSELLSTIQSLQILKIKNVPVNYSVIESIKSNNMKQLKLSHVIIQDQEDLQKILNLFKKFKVISSLSLTNIIFTKKELNLVQFYQTFNEMLNLSKLIIDIKMIYSKKDIERLRRKGVIVIINTNPYLNPRQNK